MSTLDLSTLPLPDVVESLDYESLLAQFKTELAGDDTDLQAVLQLESEPLTKLLEEFAYRYLVQTSAINHTAKSLLLAYATGTTLDHIGINRGVPRLLIRPADPSTVPPTPAVYEKDTDYRRRIHLAPERASAGSLGAYQFWSLSASGDVRDCAIESPSPGQVDVWIQSHSADIAPPALLALVDAALGTGDRTPFTDQYTVRAATPADFSVHAELTLYPGPDSAVVLAAAQQSLDAYLSKIRALGYDAPISALHAALHVPGVQRVALLLPIADLIVPRSRYARCTDIDLATVEYRDV